MVRDHGRPAAVRGARALSSDGFTGRTAWARSIQTPLREFLRTETGGAAVHFTHLGNTKAPLESPIDTDLFRAIERAAHDRESGAFVTTPMETAATDRPTYRKLGITTYGFSPFRIPRVEIQRGMHGNDERLSVDNVGYGVRFYYDILRYAQ